MAIRTNLLMTALVPMLVLLLSVLNPINAGPVPQVKPRAIDNGHFPVMAVKRGYTYTYPNATSPPFPTGTP
ncbi:hypothetical protein MMC29_000972 [Sticta canariensis]|nr:hypothetical protein [Sticta canariensis]